MFAGETSRWTIPSGPPSWILPRVRVRKRLQRLVRDEICQRRGQAGLVPFRVPLHQPRQIAADDVLLGHEVFAVDDAEVEHGHDVRVHEVRLQAGLVDELRHGVLVARQLLAQALEHEGAREPGHARRLGHEDLGHPAFAQPVDEPVAPEHLALVRGRERRGRGRRHQLRHRPRGRLRQQLRHLARRRLRHQPRHLARRRLRHQPRHLARRLRQQLRHRGRRLGQPRRQLAPRPELQGRLARQLHGHGARRRYHPSSRRRPLLASGHQQADAAQPERRRERPRDRMRVAGDLGRHHRGRRRRSELLPKHQHGLLVGQHGQPRCREHERLAVPGRARRSDELPARQRHDRGLVAGSRAAARGEDLIAHDHAHDGELLAVRPPPVFVVEQIEQRRAVDLRSDRGVERPQLGGGLNLRLDRTQLGGAAALRVLGRRRRRAHRRLGLRTLAGQRPHRDQAQRDAGGDQRASAQPSGPRQSVTLQTDTKSSAGGSGLTGFRVNLLLPHGGGPPRGVAQARPGLG